MSEPILRVEDLVVEYRTPRGVVRAVDGVSLDAYPGEMLAIVGESGSGKSTLGYAMMNLVPPPGRISRGRVIVGGIDLTRLSENELRGLRGRLVSMVFQDPFTTLDPIRRVIDQLVEVYTVHGVDREVAENEALKLLESVGLTRRMAYSYPHQLSGGQRQRVSIAMAIALKPRVVIADEPTTALDVVVQRQIMDLIEGVKRSGVCVVLITHDIALAGERADRVAVMYAGKIVEIGSKSDVLGNPQHPYTVALLSSVPSITGGKWPEPLQGSPPDLRNPPHGCRFHPRCKYAMEICRREEPPPVEIKPGHYTSCWLYVDRG